MEQFNDRRFDTTSRILSSKWTGLNPALIAKFYPVKRLQTGSGWEQSRDTRVVSAADKFEVDDGFEVHCPITEANQEMTLNWQSPFENAGPESKAPALSAMLQSGALNATLQAISDLIGVKVSGMDEAMSSVVGRTGITKLNSTQVFNGMPPVKITLTMHFRALSDPVKEVQRPIQQIEEWAVPQHLAADGLIANAAKGGTDQGLGAVAYPSVSPQIIGMQYGDMTLLPLVIESVGKPITAPRSEKGVMLSAMLPVTLATLTALDRRDIQKLYL